MFKNSQWAVTAYGVESVRPAPGYRIEAERLAKTTKRANGRFYDWPLHMSEKTWVDIEAFIEAFEQALQLHKGRYSSDVDPAMLKASGAEARRIAGR